MDFAKVTEIVAIMLSPTILVGTALYMPRAIRALRRIVLRRRASAHPQPTRPPIGEMAADLRRLLHQYDELRRSTEVAMRAKHLRAVEGAITDCAVDAADALGVPCPDRPARGPLALPDLRRLLQDLVDAGLVLPTAVGLLAVDKRT